MEQATPSSANEQKWFEDEAVIDEIELKQFESICQEACELKIKLDEIRAEEKAIVGTLEKMKKKLIAYMEKFGKTKYPVTGYGTIQVKEQFTAKMPADPADRAKFFEYLRSRNLFEQMITVHANTLNSFVDREIEVAKEEGRSDFTVPGIKEFGNYKTLSIGSK